MLENKVAIITGGTRGIGYAIAKVYAQNKATVVILGSREESVSKALEKMSVDVPSAQVTGYYPNLCNDAEIEETFRKVKEQYGHIDILVNNAGVSARDKIYDYKVEDFEKTMDLNVNAVFVCSKVAAKYMKEQGGGVILNTSSMVSIYGQPSGSAYPTSKFAVNGLTKSLARELGRDNIRVNAVAPGVTNTDMVSVLPKEVIEPIIKTIPLGRVGEPEDVANAFLFLASDLASYITGVVLSVDGAAMS